MISSTCIPVVHGNLAVVKVGGFAGYLVEFRDILVERREIDEEEKFRDSFEVSVFEHNPISIGGSDFFVGWDYDLYIKNTPNHQAASHNMEILSDIGTELSIDVDACESLTIIDSDERFTRKHSWNLPSLVSPEGKEPAILHPLVRLHSPLYESNRIYGGVYHGYHDGHYCLVVNGFSEFGIEDGQVSVNIESMNTEVGENDSCEDIPKENDGRWGYNVLVCSENEILIRSVGGGSDSQYKEDVRPALGRLAGCVASNDQTDFLFGGVKADGSFVDTLRSVNLSSGSVGDLILDFPVIGNSCAVNGDVLFSFGGFSKCPKVHPRNDGSLYIAEEYYYSRMGNCLSWIEEGWAHSTSTKRDFKHLEDGGGELFRFPINEFDCAPDIAINLSVGTFEYVTSNASSRVNCLAFRGGFIEESSVVLMGGVDTHSQVENRIDIFSFDAQEWTVEHDMYLQRIQPVVFIDQEEGVLEVFGGASTHASPEEQKNIRETYYNGTRHVMILNPDIPESPGFTAIFTFSAFVCGAIATQAQFSQRRQDDGFSGDLSNLMRTVE